MKSKLLILLCVAAFSVSPLCAAEIEKKPLTVEERLRETDLGLAIRQYERVQMEAFDAKLKLDLLDTEGQMTQDERKMKIETLEKKVMIFRMRADELRNKALKLEEDGKPRTALDRERAKLKELRNQFTDEHPSVKRQQDRVRDLEAKAK